MGVDTFQIPICLRQLLNHSAFWIENKVFPEEEIALRFKHELVSIHLFPNGNGRHSRLLADIMMKHIFQRNPFHWGSQKLNKNNLRALYIAALGQADSGNFKALLDFIHYTEKQNTTGMTRAKIKKNL